MAIVLQNTTSFSAAASASSIPSPAFIAGNNNMIVVGVRCGTNNNPTITVTDTALNTYTATRARSDYVVQGSFQMFYAKNIIGNAANIVTAAFSAGVTSRGIIVMQYSGADLASPLDVSPVSVNGNGVMTSNTITTTVANGLLVAMAQNSGGGNFSAGVYDGITMTQRVQTSTADFGAEDLVLSATHNTTATYVYSVAADFIYGQAAFKAASVPATSGQSGSIGLNNLNNLNMLGLNTIL